MHVSEAVEILRGLLMDARSPREIEALVKAIGTLNREPARFPSIKRAQEE